MSRTCQVTGRTPGCGHHVSHSHRRTSPRFGVNVQRRRSRVPSPARHVTLRLSARGTTVIDVRGIDAVAAEILRRDGRI